MSSDKTIKRLINETVKALKNKSNVEDFQNDDEIELKGWTIKPNNFDHYAARLIKSDDGIGDDYYGGEHHYFNVEKYNNFKKKYPDGSIPETDIAKYKADTLKKI